MRTVDDVDCEMLDDPEGAQKLLEAWHLLVSTPEDEREGDDLRPESVGHRRGLDPRRYPWGLDRLSHRAHPIHAGEFCVVGAREGHGKTAYAGKLALAVARDTRLLYVTLEQTAEEIRDSLLAKTTRTSVEAVQRLYELDRESYDEELREIRSPIRDLLIWKPEGKECSLRTVLARAEAVNTAVLVLDHARAIPGWEPGLKAGAIVEGLYAWAQRTHIALVLLAQLNRTAVATRPNNATFQDTGKLEQKADRALLIYRPFIGTPKDDVVELIVSKNRWGPQFRMHARWVGQSMDFFDYDEEQRDFECCRKRN